MTKKPQNQPNQRINSFKYTILFTHTNKTINEKINMFLSSSRHSVRFSHQTRRESAALNMAQTHDLRNRSSVQFSSVQDRS